MYGQCSNEGELLSHYTTHELEAACYGLIECSLMWFKAPMYITSRMFCVSMVTLPVVASTAHCPIWTITYGEPCVYCMVFQWREFNCVNLIVCMIPQGHKSVQVHRHGRIWGHWLTLDKDNACP